jgi:hypothetical protein
MPTVAGRDALLQTAGGQLKVLHGYTPNLVRRPNGFT